MALMSSGFSGQSFAFHGYLPNKKPELTKRLSALEGTVLRTGQTQLFMEAPYRNGFMLDQLTSTLSAETYLSLACDINAPTESILTMKIKDWKKIDSKKYHKRPMIFSIGRFS